MGGLVFVVRNKWLIMLIQFQFFLDKFWEKISIPGLAEQHVLMFTHAVNDRIALCLCLCTHWTQFYCARVQCALIENVVDAMAAVAAVMTFAKISRVSFTFPSQNNEGGEGEQKIQFLVVGWMFAERSRAIEAQFIRNYWMKWRSMPSDHAFCVSNLHVCVNMHAYF